MIVLMVAAASDILDRIFARCEGAYSEITLRGYRNDLERFIAWCAPRGYRWLPATPEAVATFVDQEAVGKCISTVKRRLCAIQFAHRMADLPSPVGNSEVYLAMRRAGRAKRRRPNQALGLTAELLKKIVAACPDDLDGIRDAAMFSVGYDTLCRSAELAAMRVEHLSEIFASCLFPAPRLTRLATAAGRTCHLRPRSGSGAGLRSRKLDEGPLFRGLHTNKVSDVSLDTCSIRRRVKVAAKRAGSRKREWCDGLSGHSMRVGAAQDMMVAGIDTIGIMQAGGWRSHSVLARYVENASAGKMHARRWERLGSGRERLMWHFQLGDRASAAGAHHPRMVAVRVRGSHQPFSASLGGSTQVQAFSLSRDAERKKFTYQAIASDRPRLTECVGS